MKPAILAAAALLSACAGCATRETTCRPVVPAGEARSWQGVEPGAATALTVYRPAAEATNRPMPVVLYLQNLAAPRAGTEGDAGILRDFHEAGYLVVTVDFAGRTNARMPLINRELGKLRDDLRARTLLGDVDVDMAHVFLV